MARYPKNHKSKTRRRILGAAGRIFRTHGYVAGGIGEVMGAATLTKGGFYSHFESKDDLFNHTLGHMLERSQRKTHAVLEGCDGAAAVRKAIDTYLAADHLDRTEDACPLPCLLSELPRGPQTAKELFGQFHETMTAALRDRLHAAVRDDGLSREIASGLISLLVGAVTTARAVGDREQAESILGDARRTAHLLIDCVAEGSSGCSDAAGASRPGPQAASASVTMPQPPDGPPPLDGPHSTDTPQPFESERRLAEPAAHHHSVPAGSLSR